MRMRRVSIVGLLLGTAASFLVLLLGGASGSARPVRHLAERARAHHHRRIPAAPRLDRYTVVHGCYVITSAGRPLPVAGAGPFRLQAAALGQYLLYGTRGQYVSAGPGGSLTTAAAPSSAATWLLTGDSRHGFQLRSLGGGAALPVRFRAARGCATYPEAQIDASGRTFTAAGPAASVLGTIDAHVHVTGFELFGGLWHCGRPWDAFGVTYALPDCSSEQQGTNASVAAVEDNRGPGWDPKGWPTFHSWPSPTDLAEEGTYYTAMKRAWMAGLRVMVTQLVDNEGLCTLMSQRRPGHICNDMDSVHHQAADLHALQDYIDAQSGGPGKGFFRIVTDPFQARQVINSGRLAVVEGIEVSHVLNCGESMGTPQCSQAQVDAGLREIRGLGVSTFFPIHKFDNAFGGTKMDGGETGVIVNHGNHLETGHYWDVETCKGPEHDQTQITLPGGGLVGQLMNGPVAQKLGGPSIPLYPPPPHCNTRGLTAIGAYLINQMIDHHFIVELDHMDVKTANSVLGILVRRGYSGVISAHSWDSPEQNTTIYKLGGFVTPIAGASPASFISQWRGSLKIRNPRFHGGTGFGYGADMNGLAEQSQPATAGSGHPIGYPFSSFDGRVRFAREVWGQRTFDLNRDGVANYGMYPDWLQELSLMGGRPLLADMFQGAEAYLEMWERTFGVPQERCAVSRGVVGAGGVGSLRLGSSFRSVLYGAGQPHLRRSNAYVWCVTGAGRIGTVFNRAGRVSLVATTAPGYRLASGLRRRQRGVRLVRFRRGGARWVGVSTLRGKALRAAELSVSG